jgi:hypothetical protein
MTIDRSTLTAEKIQELYFNKNISFVVESDCWLWKGRVDRSNRALTAIPGDVVGKWKSVDVRRFLFVKCSTANRLQTFRQSCNNQRCINPAHQLLIATRDVKKKPYRKVPRKFCEKGHLHSEANTLKGKGGRLICRKCQRQHERNFKRRRKGEDWQKFGDLVEAIELSGKLSKYPRKYYVYHLIDPFTSRVFYVGKGCGARLFQHENELFAGMSVNQGKDAIILSILNRGGEVQYEIVHRGLSEARALWLEQMEIERIGINNLANRICGTIPSRFRKLFNAKQDTHAAQRL